MRGYGLEPDLWLSGDMSGEKVTETTSGQLASKSEMPLPCAPSEENRAKEKPALELWSDAKVRGGDSVPKAPRCFWKIHQPPALMHTQPPQSKPGKGNTPAASIGQSVPHNNDRQLSLEVLG